MIDVTFDSTPLQKAIDFFHAWVPPKTQNYDDNWDQHLDDLRSLEEFGLPFLYRNMAIHAVLYQKFGLALNNDYFIPFSQDSSIQKGFVDGYLDIFETLTLPEVFPNGNGGMVGTNYELPAIVSLWEAVNPTVDTAKVKAAIAAIQSQVPSFDDAVKAWWASTCNTLNAALNDYMNDNTSKTFLGKLQGLCSFLYLLYAQLRYPLPDNSFPPNGPDLIDIEKASGRFCYALCVFQDFISALYFADIILDPLPSPFDNALPFSYSFTFNNLWEVPDPSNGREEEKLIWINRLYTVITGQLANSGVPDGFDTTDPNRQTPPFFPPTQPLDATLLSGAPSAPFTKEDASAIQLFLHGDGHGYWSCSDLVHAFANGNSDYQNVLYSTNWELYKKVKTALVHFYIMWCRSLSN